MSDTPSRGAGQIPAAAVASIQCPPVAFEELSSEILRAGKAVRFRAGGASMSPLVRDGDVVLVRPADPSAVRVGDVVLFAAGPGRVLVHRVIRRSAGLGGARFTIQGDQVSRPDGVIPAAQIYGKVTGIERGGVKINLDQPALRLLGWFIVLRSRWNLGSRQPYRLAVRIFRRLPSFSRHLA